MVVRRWNVVILLVLLTMSLVLTITSVNSLVEVLLEVKVTIMVKTQTFTHTNLASSKHSLQYRCPVSLVCIGSFSTSLQQEHFNPS